MAGSPPWMRVLDHYQRVGKTPDSAHGGQRDRRLRSFILTPGERDDLKAFLGSLTDAQFSPSPATLAAQPQSG